MTYIVVNNENAVLSRTSPNALLSWEHNTDYAIEFETFVGASKCAAMQGGHALRAEDYGVLVATRRPRGLGSWVGGDWGAGVVG